MKSILLTLNSGLLFALFSLNISCTAEAQSLKLSNMPVIATTAQVDGCPVLTCPSEKLTDTVHVRLSELVEDLHITRLDHSDAALVKPGSFSILSENYLFVRNQSRGIPGKLFTKDGTFIKNGPLLQTSTVYAKKETGEIVRKEDPEFAPIYHYQIDESSRRLYFTGWNTSYILYMSLTDDDSTGKFKLAGDAQFPKAVFQVQDTLLHVLGISFDAENPKTAYTAFTQGLHSPEKMLNNVPATNYARKTGRYNNEIFLIRNTKDQSVAFSSENPLPDTLYRYDPHSSRLIPKFYIQMKEGERISYNELPRYYYGTLFGTRQLDSSTYTGTRGFDFLIEKETGRGGVIALVNDFLDGGTQGMDQFCFRNGFYQYLIEPGDLKALLTRTLNTGTLTARKQKEYKQLLESIGPNDNMYLIHGRIKK